MTTTGPGVPAQGSRPPLVHSAPCPDSLAPPDERGRAAISVAGPCRLGSTGAQDLPTASSTRPFPWHRPSFGGAAAPSQPPRGNAHTEPSVQHYYNAARPGRQRHRARRIPRLLRPRCTRPDCVGRRVASRRSAAGRSPCPTPPRPQRRRRRQRTRCRGGGGRSGTTPPRRCRQRCRAQPRCQGQTSWASAL